jgi:oligosaccharide repeat unit polymerase
MIWSIGLVVGIWLTQSCSYKEHKWECSSTIKDLYFWISILCIPFFIYFVYQAITYGTSGNIAMDLRMATLGSNSHVGGDLYTPLYYVLWVVTYLLYLNDINRDHWRRAVILGFLVLLFSIATMSKALILTFGLMTLYILFRKKIISTRAILITGACLLVVMLAIHAIRQSQTMDEEQVVSIFEQYILRGFCAYDTLTPKSSEHWGENVFRLYYAVSYKLGFSDIEPINPLLPWVSKPAPTNTYSTLYPFFKDFGYAGVGIFAVLLGLMLGIVYKKAKSNNSFFIILYAYILIMVVMQYAAEYFFTNLAGHIKFVIILAIPYIVGTQKLLYVKSNS